MDTKINGSGDKVATLLHISHVSDELTLRVLCECVYHAKALSHRSGYVFY